MFRHMTISFVSIASLNIYTYRLHMVNAQVCVYRVEI